MTFGLPLLHDTFVVALALCIAIPLGTYLTYSIFVLIDGLVKRNKKDGES